MSTGWAIFANKPAEPGGGEPEKPERPPAPIPRFPSITIEGHKLDTEPGFDNDSCTPRGDGTLGAVISYSWETDMGKTGSGKIQLDHWGHGDVGEKIWAEVADVLQILDDEGVTYEGSATVAMQETGVPEGYLPGDGRTVTDTVTYYAFAPWIEPEEEGKEDHWGPFQYKIGSAYGEFENLVKKGMFQLVKEKDDDLDPFTRPTGDKDYMKNAKWTLELISGGSEGQPYVRVVPIGQSDPKYNPLFNSYRTVIDGSGTPADKNNPLLTNEFGQIVIYDLPYGTYRLKEIAAEVEGYVLEDYVFTVNENGQILSQDINDYVIKNEVVVEKVDSETGKTIPMAGTAFRIRYMGNPNTAAAGGDVTKDPHYGTYLPNGSSINDSYKWVFYTDFNGKIVLPYELEYGLYQLEEIVAPEGWTEYYIDNHYMVRNIENPDLYMVYVRDMVQNQNRWVPADVDGTTFTEYTQKLSMRLTQHSSSADGWSLAMDDFEFINIADAANEEATATFVNPSDAEAEVIPAGGSEAETADKTTTITVRMPEPSAWYKTGDGIQIGTIYQGGYTKTVIKVPEGADLPEIAYKNGAAIDYDSSLTPDNPRFEQIQDQYNYLRVRLQAATAESGELRVIELVSDAETEEGSWQVRLPSGHLMTAVIIDDEDGLKRGQLTFDALAKTMRYPQGVVVETIRTGADGIATSSALPLGDYLVREAAASNGYATSKDVYPVSFSYEGQYVPLIWGSTSVSNDSFSVQLDLRKSFETAYGSGTFVPKAGAVFGVFAKEPISGGSPIGSDLQFDTASIDAGSLLYLLTTDSDGKAIQTVKLPEADYYVKELATLDGYILNDQEFPFRVDEETTSDELHFSYPLAGISGQVVHSGYQSAEIRIDTRFQFPAVAHKVSGMEFWSDTPVEGKVGNGVYVDNIVELDYSSIIVKMGIYEPVAEIELSNGSTLTVTLTDEGYTAVFTDPEDGEAVEIPTGKVDNLTTVTDGQTTTAEYNPVIAYTGYQLSAAAPFIAPETLLSLDGIKAGFEFDLASGRKNIVIDYTPTPDLEVKFDPEKEPEVPAEGEEIPETPAPIPDGITWDKQNHKIIIDTSVSAVQKIAIGSAVFNLTADSIQADGASVPQGYHRDGLTGTDDSLIWQNKKISLSSASGLAAAEAALTHDQRMTVVSVTAGTANGTLLDGIRQDDLMEPVTLNPGQQLLILASDGSVFTFELSNTGTLTAKVDGIVSGELTAAPKAALNGSAENLLTTGGKVLLQTIPMDKTTVDVIRLQANKNLTFARSSSYVNKLEVKINAGSGNTSAPIVNKPEKPEKPEEPEEPKTPENPKPKEMTISKIDTTTAKGVPGAEIEVLDKDGKVIAAGKSDVNGKFRFSLPKPGTYTFHEIVAPDGYILNEELYSFTVHKDGSITGNDTIENQWEMSISKKDTTTAEGVPGAEIEVLDKDGNIIASGKSDEDGEFKFGMPKPGTYYFHEVIAPEGYILNEELYSFTIHEDGSITGDHTILNRRKIGRIDLSTDEWLKVDEDDTPTTGLDIPSPPQTGESFLKTGSQAENVLQVTFIQGIDDKTALPETLEQNGRNYKLLNYSCAPADPGEAPEPIEEAYTGLESQDESALPQTIVWDGITYTLDGAIFEEIPGAERTVRLTKQMTAENGVVPEENRITYYDELFDETVQATLPLAKVDQAEPVWAADKIDSRYYDYDAGLFQLGNALIPKNDAAPNWQGFEADILAYLDESPESCRLTGSAWVGETYELDGVLVRGAVYYCERLIPGSSTATYDGIVTLRREAPSYTATAVYAAPVPEVTEQVVTARYGLIVSDELTPLEPLPELPEPEGMTTLAKVLIFGGVLLILGLLTAAILFVLKKKRREKEEKIQRINAKR